MKTVKTSICEQCGTEYPHREKKRFCSSTCRRKAFQERSIKESVTEITKPLQEERKILQSIISDNIDMLPKSVQEALKLKEEYPEELCGRDVRKMTKQQIMKIVNEFRQRRSAT